MKKMILAVAAFFAFSVVASDTSYAAKNDNSHKKEHLQQQKNEKKEVKNVDKQKKPSKGNTQQLKSIDKQLDKIEEKLNHYQEKLPKIDASIEEEQSTTTNDTVNVDPTTGTITTGTTTTETTTTETSTEKAEATTEQPVTEASTTTEEDSDEESTTEEESDEDVDQELDKYPGYKGKLNALKNRLNAVTNRLDSLSSKSGTTEELQARYDQVKSLIAEIDKALASIDNVQNEIKEDISNDETVEELAPAEDVATTKEWKIQFSNDLDISTLSNLDVVILDSNQNIVETTITYSEETKTVSISPVTPYQSGESYTLYIGNKISAENGTNLTNSVTKEFTVQ